MQCERRRDFDELNSGLLSDSATRGRCPNRLLGLSLNEGTILFLLILLYKTVSVTHVFALGRSPGENKIIEEGGNEPTRTRSVSVAFDFFFTPRHVNLLRLFVSFTEKEESTVLF